MNNAPGPLPLSVAIVTLNEEANLPRLLESVRGLAAEIVVIDSGSTDRTEEIAREYGARFEHADWAGFITQKNHSLDACTQPWVLFLDADEALSPELAASLKELFANGCTPEKEGYWLNRRTWYLGAWIWHTWHPEWRLRLLKRGAGRWGGMDPHDRLDCTGASWERNPVKRTLSATPSSAASAVNSASNGPSPASVRCARGWLSANRANARSVLCSPFFGINRQACRNPHAPSSGAVRAT